MTHRKKKKHENIRKFQERPNIVSQNPETDSIQLK